MSVNLAPNFDEERHEYSDAAGNVVRSVTQIIGDYWPIDRSHYSEEPRARGTAIHAALEEIDKKKSSYSSYSMLPHFDYIEAWELFKADTGYQVEQTEQPFIYEEYSYAGTVDRVGMMQRERVLIDIKTGGPADWHELQQGAYAAAMIGADINIDAIATVFLRPNGKYKYKKNSLDRALLGWGGLMTWINYRRIWK